VVVKALLLKREETLVLQLTKRGDYAVLAMYYIAQHPRGKFMSIEEISAKSEVPKSYLGKILQDLCRGGLLLSRRGTGGGFMLARNAVEISLRDIIETIEGKICLATCTWSPDQCHQAGKCPIEPLWQEMLDFIRDLIGSISVEELVRPDQRRYKILQLETCRQMYREKVKAMPDVRGDKQ
jgi:Rrf2 family transcriptional regulator, iron-sulfur cluster assembly transcription factor